MHVSNTAYLWMIIAAITVFSQSASALTNIDSCQNLTADVSSADCCFHLIANNVTLDGARYWVNYSQVSTGYAINNSECDNITIKNQNQDDIYG